MWQWRWAARPGVAPLAVGYRLAPEHPFPAPVEDTVAAYRYLLDSDFRPERMCFAGDSAGGGLAIGAMLAGVADGRVDLRIWPEMIHVWHVYFPMLAAARRAITAGGTFVRSTLRGA